jgi:nucleoside-diphosphate-sugar epimerase
VFGGKQLRPHLNILDMVRVYEMFLDAPAEKIHCVPFNAGFQNTSVEETAFTVMKALGDDKISLEYVPTDDMRSYHINSDRIRRVLGFTPKYSVQDAVLSIAQAYKNGLLTDPLKNPLYHNILRMKELALG